MRKPSYASRRSLFASAASVRLNPVGSAAAVAVELLEQRTFLSTTLTPTQDTFVRNNNFTLTNFGASPTLFVKNASAGTGDDRISYLMFNLAGVTTINSAVLQLSGALQSSSATPATTGVFAVADTTWVQGDGTIVDSIGTGFDTNPNPPNAITWNNMPAVASTALATATVTSSAFQTYSFDITSYLNNYLKQQGPGGNTLVSLALENLQPTSQETEFLSSKSTSPDGSVPKLVIDDGSPTGPIATVSAPDVKQGSSEQVSVTYSAGAGLNAATISSSNITVTRYAGNSALNVEPNVATTQNNDGSITAVYTVDAPGGTWTTSANGSYAIAVQPGSVLDNNGLGVSAAFGSFRVNVGDTVPPTAKISAADVSTAGGGTYSFTVTYSDNVAVDVSSITLQNVSISSPVGPLKITSVSTNPSSNAAQIVATYTATAPNGAWAASDDGQFTVTLGSNQVADSSGNTAPSISANFYVKIAVPDTVAPSASIAAPNVTSPGGTSEIVTVTYTDNVAVQASTISGNNITVTGPGGTTLAVTGVSTSGSGPSIIANYTVAAPAGGWNASDNGTYSISLAAGAVTDTSGNPVVATTASFNVSAAVADTQPPTAAISAPAISSAGGATQTIAVAYTDNIAVDASSVGLANLSVSGPGGPLTVTSFTVSGGTGPSVTATYTVQAPNGSWDAADNGTYNVALNANQIHDTSGNAAPVIFSSFAVNIPLPNPSDPSFNSGNPVTYPFVAQATVTQANGQILLVGYQSTSATANQGVIQRLNANGTVDTTFGNNGQVVTPAGNVQWYSVILQGANHLVVAGTDGGQFALARYDFAGNLDPTFGSGGVELTSFGGANTTAYSLALSPTGQIVAGGTSNNRFAFARYDANGNLDASFGQAGRQIFDTGAATQVIGAIAVENDGQIVGAGSSGSNIEVIRLTVAGDPDATFHSDGVVAAPGLAASGSGSQLDYTVGLALQGNGKILVGGQSTTGHFGIVRLNTDGSTDTSFGTGGIAIANFGGQDEAESVVVQANGDIIAVGTSLVNSQPLTAVAAFDSAGKLITGFGENGKATFTTATAPVARELHIGQLALRAFGGQTPNGAIVVGTSSSGGTQTVTSSLRRILVPGTTAQPAIQESLIGVFGLVNRKNVRLMVNLGSGRQAVFTLTGGATGTLLQAGNDIHVEVTSPGSSVLNIRVVGGGTVGLSNVDITGSLSAIHATAAVVSGNVSATALGNVIIGQLLGNLTTTSGLGSFATGNIGGTITVGGNLGRLKAGAISGKVVVAGNILSVTAGDVSGTIYSGANLVHGKVGNVTGLIAAASQLASLTAASLSNATILAGTTLPGGILGSGDTYAAGSIGTLHVNGAISSSFIGAGVNPVDGTFGNGNDTAAGSGTIKTIFARGGADAATKFEASSFGNARLPAKVVVTTDPRFVVL